MLGPFDMQFARMLLGSLCGLDGSVFGGYLGSSVGNSLGLGLGSSLGGLSGVLLSLSSGLLCPLLGTLGLLGGLGLALSLTLLLSSGDLGGTLSLGSGLTLGNELIGGTELVGETLDASASIDELLLASVERMASAADFDADLGLGGTRLERVAAAARYGAIHVIGMDTLLHFYFSFSALVSDQGRLNSL